MSNLLLSAGSGPYQQTVVRKCSRPSRCVVHYGDIGQAMGAGGKLSGQLSVVYSVCGPYIYVGDIEHLVS